MVSSTVSPSLAQGRVQIFESNFLHLAQQENTRLGGSPAVSYLPSGGYSHNVARIGRVELDEVNARNPEKEYEDYAVDNRRFTKRRFTKTLLIDDKYDIDEMIANPTGDLVMQINAAKNRVIDRIIAAQAVGSVLTGAPDAAATTTTAANDGVLTVDATGGVTYAKINEVTENFINNDLTMEDMRGSVICVTGTENTALMNQTNFISNDFIDGRPVSAGVVDKAGMYYVERFAGSNASITVPTPIIPESSGTRTCMVLAPKSVLVSMEVGRLDVTRSALHVNSWEITIDLWINAMRTEGARVQKFNTTISS